jgi:uncharacterized SAM-binding protein YcdF (DUF218 family)
VAPPVIVIFGAAVRPDGSPSPVLRRRVEAAFAWGTSLASPVLYIPTGAAGRFGPPEAEVMAELLRGYGVPPDAILREETAVSTLTSVQAVAAMLRSLRPHGVVYAASCAYHLPRCVMLLRMAGLRTRRCPPPAWPDATARRRVWYWRIREAVALPVDMIAMTRLLVAGWIAGWKHF